MVSLWDIGGHWFAIFITIATLSYLYEDNPFYKFAEHLYIGTTIGYEIIVQFYDTVKPNLIDRLGNPALGMSRLVYIGLLLLVVFLFMRFNKNLAWLGRIPIAFIIGIYAGQNVPAVANSDLVAQVQSTLESVRAFAAGETASSQFPMWAQTIGIFVLVTGLIAGLVYFFFSIEHKGVVRPIARYGVWVLMIGFGASFGFTVQGRISLAIGRAMECLGVNESAEQAAAFHSRLVSAICVLLIFGSVYLIQRRQSTNATRERGESR